MKTLALALLCAGLAWAAAAQPPQRPSADLGPETPRPLNLGPRDVLVVANADWPASLEVARHYLKKRGVPEEHLIALPLPKTEEISRAAYDDFKKKLFAALRERRPAAKILLLAYGVPLRVGPSSPSEADQKKANELTAEQEKLAPQLKEATEKAKAADRAHILEPSDQNAKAKAATAGKVASLANRRRQIEESLILLSHADSVASVDSELACLWWPSYPTARWVPNPLNWRMPRARRAQYPPTLMVARLDGPSVTICKGMVDDAIEAEEKGLEGDLWIDSRGIPWNAVEDPTATGYGGYDQALRELFTLVREKTKLDAHIDVKPELYAPRACKNTALYCGWYSHAQFIDCCIFRKGAVAVHIASSEAVSLRDLTSAYWCKNQLLNGACATMGPVAEPYLFAFPRPGEFFGFLLTGEYTLAECYWNTLSVCSWRMTLVGDPLYRPYAKKPLLKPEQVRPSPAGSKAGF